MKPSEATGKHLREWRERLGFSRPKAASELGLSQISIRNYEYGKRSDRGTVLIPRIVAWACAAIAAGLKPLGHKE